MFLIKLQKNSVFGHFAIICEIPSESFAPHSIHNMLIINELRVPCQTLFMTMKVRAAARKLTLQKNTNSTAM